MNATAPAQHIFWIGDTLWSVYGDARPLLFAAHRFQLDQWLQRGDATLIKPGIGPEYLPRAARPEPNCTSSISAPPPP